MAYRLDPALEVPAALRAVAAEQLDDALAQLRGDGEKDPVEAVHEARKDLKKVRSLLRLARAGLPTAARRELNDALREVATALAGTRDADVIVETVDALQAHYHDRTTPRAYAIVRRRFQREAGQPRRTADVLGDLQALRDAVDEWPLSDGELSVGAVRAYERGRQEYTAARSDPSVEQLHEWRKRVKDLWYHARLLEAAWPGPLAALAEAAHDLSDFLGDDHDLGVLAERIEAQVWPPSVDERLFVALCHERRGELQEQAFTLGAKVYAERPGAFARRLRAYVG